MPNKSYGIKVSQRNFDVRTAKDYKLEYSSSFPNLPIVAEGSFSVSGTSPPNTIATHNLGYVPFFFIFHDDNSSSGFDNGAPGQAFGTDGFHAKDFRANSSTLTWHGSYAMTGYYYIYGLDLESEFTAPVIQSGTTEDSQRAANSYGVRVSKDGADVFSNDLRDFTVHSGTRSPIIHSITTGTKTASPAGVTITHGMNTVPFPLVYYKLSGNTRWSMLTTATDTSVAVTTTQATFSLPYACDYSVILLKEPLTVS